MTTLLASELFLHTPVCYSLNRTAKIMTMGPEKGCTIFEKKTVDGRHDPSVVANGRRADGTLDGKRSWPNVNNQHFPENEVPDWSYQRR